MTRADDVLDLIDSAVHDYTVGVDAMRSMRGGEVAGEVSGDGYTRGAVSHSSRCFVPFLADLDAPRADELAGGIPMDGWVDEIQIFYAEPLVRIWSWPEDGQAVDLILRDASGHVLSESHVLCTWRPDGTVTLSPVPRCRFQKGEYHRRTRSRRRR